MMFEQTADTPQFPDHECIRMRNEDVVDLFERVKVGTRVMVL